MIEIPAADQATVEKFAGQYLEGFNLIGETLIRRWWTIATAGRRQALVDLVMELAAATETAAGDISRSSAVRVRNGLGRASARRSKSTRTKLTGSSRRGH